MALPTKPTDKATHTLKPTPLTGKTDRLEDVFNAYKMNPHDAAKKSAAWFQQQIALIGRVRATRYPSTLFADREVFDPKTSILPGSLYIFHYDALNKATLPYWDRYPLVIPFRAVPGGFYGLNLHYLPPQGRVLLLDALMRFATNKNMDANTKLKFTWQAAVAASQNKHIAACIKHYLLPQVKSKFQKIMPENWVGALMLPVESFTGATKTQVWKESRRA